MLKLDLGDGSGNGPGQTWVGEGNVTTNGSSNATFNFTFDVDVPEGWTVSATATDPDGNTSEFSTFATMPAAPVSDGDSLAPTGQNALPYTLLGIAIILVSSVVILRYKIARV